MGSDVIGRNENNMNTSTAVINKVILDGYTECFKAEHKGLFAPSTGKYYRPKEVNIINFYRFEGDSDPGDNSILYVVETTDGVKGTLLDAYGAEGSTNVTDFMNKVGRTHKQ
ncbi:MAG: hypothetical protein K0Q79_2954 [Flavipsychrobacter sp.]|jgi:hypothetical protein|nr:hypothetical protein [Flavipsychrobacter sp.]